MRVWGVRKLARHDIWMHQCVMPAAMRAPETRETECGASCAVMHSLGNRRELQLEDIRALPTAAAAAALSTCKLPVKTRQKVMVLSPDSGWS